MKTLDALFTPADFTELPRRNLDDTVCVVFDVFRATSSMITALSHGARAIVPVADIEGALAFRRQDHAVLLAGERDGVRIRSALTGGTDFDLGNSPREFASGAVAGKTIVMTTTNGTRALRACAHAGDVLIGAFLNLEATADWLERRRPDHLLLVCSGTFEQAALEDVLAAGVLCDRLWDAFSEGERSDSALIARRLYLAARPDLAVAASQSRNGRRLLGHPELAEDVPFCLRMDTVSSVAKLFENGEVRWIGSEKVPSRAP
jgi:2-phosphosulfolactate phosphatase